MTLPLTLAEALKRYGVDLVSHPLSRGIDDIETAGCLMLEAKRWIEKLEAENKALQAEKQEQQELTDEQIHSACLSYRQLNALRLRRGTPAAWVNFNAATGERNVSFVCESELASIPLWPEPPCEQGVNK
jgi:hypothetical protein